MPSLKKEVSQLTQALGSAKLQPNYFNSNSAKGKLLLLIFPRRIGRDNFSIGVAKKMFANKFAVILDRSQAFADNPAKLWACAKAVPVMKRTATEILSCSASLTTAKAWRSFNFFYFYFSSANGAGSEMV
jgi:hypothetical protein